MLDRLDHANLVVRDLEGMIRFYTEVLGLVLTKRVTISGDWVDLAAGLEAVEAEVVYLDAVGDTGGTRVELIRFVRPARDRPGGLEYPNTPGLRHLAFRTADIDRAVRNLKTAGVKLVGDDISQVPDSQVTYAGGVRKRLIYFHDPEQNLLELCEYA